MLSVCLFFDRMNVAGNAPDVRNCNWWNCFWINRKLGRPFYRKKRRRASWHACLHPCSIAAQRKNHGLDFGVCVFHISWGFPVRSDQDLAWLGVWRRVLRRFVREARSSCACGRGGHAWQQSAAPVQSSCSWVEENILTLPECREKKRCHTYAVEIVDKNLERGSEIQEGLASFFYCISNISSARQIYVLLSRGSVTVVSLRSSSTRRWRRILWRCKFHSVRQSPISQKEKCKLTATLARLENDLPSVPSTRTRHCAMRAVYGTRTLPFAA
jgi:hypothetical protein